MRPSEQSAFANFDFAPSPRRRDAGRILRNRPRPFGAGWERLWQETGFLSSLFLRAIILTAPFFHSMLDQPIEKYVVWASQLLLVGCGVAIVQGLLILA